METCVVCKAEKLNDNNFNYQFINKVNKLNISWFHLLQM